MSEIQNLRPTKVYKGHTDQITCLPLHPQQKIIASGAKDGRILLHHLESGEILTKRWIKEEPIQSLIFSPDGNRLLFVGGNCRAAGTSKLWNLTSDTLVGSYYRKVDQRSNMYFKSALSPDGSLFALGASDMVIDIVDAKNGSSLIQLEGYDRRHIKESAEDEILALAFSDNNKHLVSSARGDITVWRLSDGYCLKTYPRKNSGARSLVFSRNQNSIYSIDYTGLIEKLNLLTGEVETLPSETIGNQLISHNNNLLVSTNERAPFARLKPDGTPMYSLNQLDMESFSLQETPNETRLITCGPHGRVCIRNFNSGESILQYQIDKKEIKQFCFLNDRIALFTEGPENEIICWGI